MKELKHMNWHEWIEMKKYKKLKKGIEIKDLKWRNWNSRIETNELNWMNDMNKLKWMNWEEWVAKISAPSPSAFTVFMWNRALATASYTFCRPHLPQMIWDSYYFYMKSSSRYSLMHILSAASWKSGPMSSVFFAFFCERKLSLQSRAHFVDLIFQKWSESVSFRFLCR